MDKAEHNNMNRLAFVDDLPQEYAVADAKRRSFARWPFVTFAVIFIAFYASVLVGWLRPVADISLLARLEPIIFVVIGFYFGRSPSVETEYVLQQQLEIEKRKAAQTNDERERLKKECDVMSERIKSANLLLNEWPLERHEGGGKIQIELLESTSKDQLVLDRVATVKHILSL